VVGYHTVFEVEVRRAGDRGCGKRILGHGRPWGRGGKKVQKTAGFGLFLCDGARQNV